MNRAQLSFLVVCVCSLQAFALWPFSSPPSQQQRGPAMQVQDRSFPHPLVVAVPPQVHLSQGGDYAMISEGWQMLSTLQDLSKTLSDRITNMFGFSPSSEPIPGTRVYAAPDSYDMYVEMPGISPEYIRTAIDDSRGTIKVSGRVQCPGEQDQAHLPCIMRDREAEFMLPRDADTQYVRSYYNLGVLRVHVPRIPPPEASMQREQPHGVYQGLKQGIYSAADAVRHVVGAGGPQEYTYPGEQRVRVHHSGKGQPLQQQPQQMGQQMFQGGYGPASLFSTMTEGAARATDEAQARYQSALSAASAQFAAATAAASQNLMPTNIAGQIYNYMPTNVASQAYGYMTDIPSAAAERAKEAYQYVTELPQQAAQAAADRAREAYQYVSEIPQAAARGAYSVVSEMPQAAADRARGAYEYVAGPAQQAKDTAEHVGRRVEEQPAGPGVLQKLKDSVLHRKGPESYGGDRQTMLTVPARVPDNTVTVRERVYVTRGDL